jgi:group I intron endonuclease
MNRCGVYVICCEPTGSRYVGASTHIVKRIREHFYRLEKDVHRNHRLRSAYNEYGKDSFSSKVLLYCDPTDLELFGKQIIEKLRPEFNIVNTEHTKGATHRNFRALLKEDDKLTRQIQEVESVLKRTHRL